QCGASDHGITIAAITESGGGLKRWLDSYPIQTPAPFSWAYMWHMIFVAARRVFPLSVNPG
ncbi:hypothetical protein, partial [Aeromicrobium sp.]|uniref:hypothetical protein n=1 Tax=Aeromicrobium sp. TaxID=1871063 RepID=UPI0025C66E0D